MTGDSQGEVADMLNKMSSVRREKRFTIFQPLSAHLTAMER